MPTWQCLKIGEGSDPIFFQIFQRKIKTPIAFILPCIHYKVDRKMDNSNPLEAFFEDNAVSISI